MSEPDDVVTTPLLPPGTFIMGDLKHGARLYEPHPTLWQRFTSWLRRR